MALNPDDSTKSKREIESPFLLSNPMPPNDGASGGSPPPHPLQSPGPPPAPEIDGMRCLAYIGHGGLGDVWLFEDEGHVWCAIKVPFPNAAERDLEAYVLYKNLVGPNSSGLLPLEAIGRTKGNRIYYRLPIADDIARSNHEAKLYRPRSLAAELKQQEGERKALAPDEILKVARAILFGLRTLHNKGLVHCDVKPDNILSFGENWLLGDTGLLRGIKYLPSERGTPAFTPPEGIRDYTADLYALGKTLYIIAGGDARRFPELDYPEVSCADETAKARLQIINRAVLKACDPDPKQRFQSADEMLADLAKPRPTVPALSPTQPRVTMPWSRVAAVSVFIAAGFVAASVWYSRSVPTAVPLEVRRFCVYIRESTDDPEARQACLGEGAASFDRALLGQYAQVAIELSQPAYFYVIAFKPDGKDQLFWPMPDKNGTPAERILPTKNSGLQPRYGFHLTDGVGVQVFSFIASLDPLPAYSDWKQRHGNAPWSHTNTPGIWAYDGIALNALPKDRNERGEIVEMNDPSPIEPLFAHLRRSAADGVVRAIAFPVMDAKGTPNSR